MLSKRLMPCSQELHEDIGIYLMQAQKEAVVKGCEYAHQIKRALVYVEDNFAILRVSDLDIDSEELFSVRILLEEGKTPVCLKCKKDIPDTNICMRIINNASASNGLY